MPDKETIRRARKDKRQGKSASTQAGEFVREEFLHIREGKHGARSPEQAIAIGLSKARRAGVDMPPPKTGSAETRRKAERDEERGQSGRGRARSPRRSRAVRSALKREGRSAASPEAIGEHSHDVAVRRGPAARHRSAMKAARSRTRSQRSASVKKAARTRTRSGSSSRRPASRRARG